ncbi:MAG: hypothetical protein RID53_10185 [Coleofasciculus sp. B1-GNL1-01]|uniref:hypothetical protein n=1 Tax=Coleofasciculus sp. B1-GNL1-01 TaxID=3068484 RepID=UPI003304D19F
MITQLIQAFKPKDAKLTVSTSFDNKYLDYGKILLRSIIKNSPRVKVIILAINIAEEEFQEFSNCDNIEFIYEQRQFYHAYEQRLYSLARRIFLIDELRQDSSVENLLQLDSDLIVYQNLNKFSCLFQRGDFLIFARPHMRYEFLRLTMNVLGLSNSPAAKALTREWVRQLWRLLEQPQDSKYLDQLTLWKAYDKINQEYEIKLVNLKSPFIGSKRNDIIRKFTATKNAKGNKKLLNELNKFANNQLKDVPSNAPAQPESKNIYLHKDILKEHFIKAGFTS